MKIQQCLPLILMLVLLAGPVSHSLEASVPSPAYAPSLSSCGVARGFASGVMLGATIAALTPGGQTAAIILALTGLSMKISTSIMC